MQTVNPPRHLIAAAVAALGFAAAARILIGWGAPFWFDEAFTGMIAIGPSLDGLIQDCLRELSGPVYYVFIWLWEKVFGARELALRLPSLIFGLAAPLVILGSRLDRQTRWTWAAITALWVPGIHFASEARSYSLLLLLATLQLMAYQRLLEEPKTSRAVTWVLVSEMLILTHYHSLFVILFQGLAYLGRHRWAALRTWPAALAFLPAAIWMGIHLHVVLRFASADVAWQPLLTVGELFRSPFTIMGGKITGALILIVMVQAVWDLYRAATKRISFPYSLDEVLIIGVSVASIAVVLILGAIRPGFQLRYLTPFIPGLLFGIALWSRQHRWLPYVVIALFTLQGGVVVSRRLIDPMEDHRYNFSWDVASRDFQASGVKRIFFLVDSSTSSTADPQPMERLGRFFYDRDGIPVEVVPVLLNGRADRPDPNRVLLRAADRQDDALIWIYIVGTRNTLATLYPPRISSADRSWHCRNYGRNSVFVIGCVRRHRQIS